MGAITAPFEACTVFNNTVEGSIISGSPQDTPQIYNNTVSGGGIQCTGYGSIFNNYIYGCQKGICLYATRVFGGYLPCYATVENNLIEDNTQGIDISLASVFGPGTSCPTILNNTIFENSVGIYLSESYYNSAPTIQNNNLQNNSNYNFYLQAPNIVNATNNYWGTTNTQAINPTIYDFKNDFNLGVVTFVPFSTAPNPQAPSAINPIVTPSPSPTATSTPTQNSTSIPTPTVPELSWFVILALFLSILSFALVHRHQKSLHQVINI